MDCWPSAPLEAAFPRQNVAALNGYIAPRSGSRGTYVGDSQTVSTQSHETIVVFGIGLLYHVEALQGEIRQISNIARKLAAACTR